MALPIGDVEKLSTLGVSIGLCVHVWCFYKGGDVLLDIPSVVGTRVSSESPLMKSSDNVAFDHVVRSLSFF